MNLTSYRYRLSTVIFGCIFFSMMAPIAQAYIGPGAGFAVVGSLFAVIGAFFATCVVLLTWPIRYLVRLIRGRKALAKSKIKRAVILGLDGLEPTVTEKMLREGKLPNLARLKEMGCYRRLGTTLPPLSPVAWSSFQTGCNPGKHNIFDFLSRDKKTYYPKISSVEIKGPKKVFKIGKYQIPLGAGEITFLRKAKSFWKILGEHGIFSNIIRVPITFPPEKFYGVMLSAMCVPDLRGTQGMFSFYSTNKSRMEAHTGGESFYVERNGNIITANIIGPQNSFLQIKKEMQLPFKLTANNPTSALLEVSGQKVTLKLREYSPWIEVTFKPAPGVKVKGLCQVLLLNADSDIELYITPVNISPETPAMPISHPVDYAKYLAKKQGLFATLGLTEDSWALNEKVVEERHFKEQCDQADDEREEMFFDALDKVSRGLVVCVFDGTDRMQHIFWRYQDEGHPANGDLPSIDGHDQVLENLYIKMDAMVGKTMAKCEDDDTMLMVISDHGFNAFRYGVDLNKWLLDNGYLYVIDGSPNADYLTNIDWSRTRAYATGLAGLYLNIKGREAKGIVKAGLEADTLRDEICKKLTGLRDEAHNDIAIKKAYNALKAYVGPYKTEAPDIIVGYNKGYRVSWETAVGRLTDTVILDNIKAWSGDHCIDPSLVPGVLFCNRNIEEREPRLMDLAPTTLNMFGVTPPANMDGKPLNFVEEKKTV